MKQLLERLSPREKILAAAGAAVLAGLSFYEFIYNPVLDEQALLETAAETQRQLLDYLRAVSAEAEQLRRQSVGTIPTDEGQSPIGVIDASSEQLGVKTAIKRMTPEGGDKLTLWLEKCPFDKLILWLAALESKHGIKVGQITINREPGEEGLVNGKILLMLQ